jgi:hypothetical protein
MKKKPALLVFGKDFITHEVTVDTITVSFDMTDDYSNVIRYQIQLIEGAEAGEEFIKLECGNFISKDIAVALAKKILEVAKVK